jgi:hypothetical protein
MNSWVKKIAHVFLEKEHPFEGSFQMKFPIRFLVFRENPGRSNIELQKIIETVDISAQPLQPFLPAMGSQPQN